MNDPTSIPYLRAAVCFLEDRLSILLPERAGLIEFAVCESDLPEMEAIAAQDLPATWAAWMSCPEPPPVAAILRLFPELHQVVRLLRFCRQRASEFRRRSGPFETFAVIIDALVRQCWLRSGPLIVGSRWRDTLQDPNCWTIRDSEGNARVRCWMDAAACPVRLLAHLSQLASEMAEAGEPKGLFAELGILDVSKIDLRAVEAEVRSAARIQNGAIHGPPLAIAASEDLPAHIREYRDCLANGFSPAEAAGLANARHGKNLDRKSYNDIWKMYLRKSRRAA